MAKPTTEKPTKKDVESDSDESDDEDYAPDEKDFQSEGEDVGDSSDDDNANDDSADNNNTSTTRSGKRRADTSSSSSSSQKKPKPDNEPTPQEQAEALRKKSRLDALWAEMNNPVSSKPDSSAQRLDVSILAGSGSATAGTGGGGGGSGRMVTITTTYDFAGETVTVTKDVPEDSKEAKDYAAKKNVKAGPGTKVSSDAKTTTPTTTTTTTVAKDSILSTAQNLGTATAATSLTAPNTKDQDSTSSPSSSIAESSSTSTSAVAAGEGPRITKSKPPVRYIRRKSTLDQLATTYGVKKPPKLNTLEKSKLDWKNFVGKEGIEDELKHHNKDGYMEKVAFLQRTDERRDAEYQELKKKRR
ncbi:swr complex subunit [Mortierella sp. AD032]|nr:swr complex subunit [Mortierella sp. AD032]